jgi:hypothetical protein
MLGYVIVVSKGDDEAARDGEEEEDEMKKRLEAIDGVTARDVSSYADDGGYSSDNAIKIAVVFKDCDGGDFWGRVSQAGVETTSFSEFSCIPDELKAKVDAVLAQHNLNHEPELQLICYTTIG